MMITQRIDFQYGSPDAITVTMSVAEAAFITTLLGRMNDLEQDNVIAGGAHAGRGIYDCLTGDLFNRYWDDGVDGYLSGDRS